MKEIWKDIKGYEGIYQVSTHGRIKSLSREVKGLNGMRRSLEERVMVNISHYKGYSIIFLSKENTKIKFYIHRIVAETFIENWEDEAFVNHRNGSKTDNRVENLEWTSPSNNTIHYYNGVTTMEERNANF